MRAFFSFHLYRAVKKGRHVCVWGGRGVGEGSRELLVPLAPVSRVDACAPAFLFTRCLRRALWNG